MKNKIYKTLILLFCLKIISCNHSKENVIETITINFNNIIPINVRDTTLVKILPLEDTDASLLEEIQDVDFINDKILIYKTNKVTVFDKEGNFLFNIDRVGSGPGEYVHTTSFFVKQNEVFLFDDILQKVFIYNENGEWIATYPIESENEISLLYPLENGGYIAKNKYQGENNRTPCVSLFNSRLKKTESINNRILQSAEIDYDNFYSYEDNILYWEFLNDTIYSINQQNKLFPKYYVNFGQYKIPDNLSNDKNKIVEYINESNNPNIATCIKYIQEDASYIRLVFIQKESIVNYVTYDKESKKVEVFRLIDLENKLSTQLFMLYRNNYIIMVVQDMDNYADNPKLVFINIDRI